MIRVSGTRCQTRDPNTGWGRRSGDGEWAGGEVFESVCSQRELLRGIWRSLLVLPKRGGGGGGGVTSGEVTGDSAERHVAKFSVVEVLCTI